MGTEYNKNLITLARNLRKNMTEQERHLWYVFLKYYPIKFYRQRVIGNYIADFYSVEAKLIIEIDGAQHYEEINEKKDNERTAYFNSLGIKVIRISNNDINRDFKNVCQHIDNVVKEAIGRDTY